MIKFFIKDFCETVQTRVVIFGMQVDNDVLYRGIAKLPSPACSSLHLSDLLSFHTLNNESFRQRLLWWNDEIFLQGFLKTMQARRVIFSMQVDDKMVYH